MFQRAPSRLIRPRHTSPRHQSSSCDKACIYSFVIVLLLFCTLAIFQAKLGSPPPTDNVTRLGRRSISQIPPFKPKHGEIPASAFQQSNANQHALSVSESESLHSASSLKRKLGDVTSGNSSTSLVQEDESDDDEDEDAEVDGELELDEELDGNALEDVDIEDEIKGMDEEPDKEDDEDEESKVDEASLDKHTERSLADGDTAKDSDVSSKLDHLADAHSMNNDLVKKTSDETNNEFNNLSMKKDEAHTETKTANIVEKLGVPKTVPRWDPLEDMGGRNKSTYVSLQQGSGSNELNAESGVKWDHLLGVFRKPGKSRNHDKSRRSKINNDSSKPGQNENAGDVDSRLIFTSDDELLDQDVRNKLEDINAIEDALLLKDDKIRSVFVQLWTDRSRKERSLRTPFDPLNPVNNPLLQDPDTSGPTGLSGSDKAILKALRKASNGKSLQKSPKVGNIEEKPEIAKPEDRNQASKEQYRSQTSTRKDNKDIHMKLGNSAERSILEASVSDSKNAESGSPNSVSNRQNKKPYSRPRHSDTMRRWGYYPGIDPSLSFIEFLEHFLNDHKCSINVFMAWTTPPWSYTIRYQRGLESLLYFHPQACVVVFSETLELNFFMNFLEDGFKVAVVVPNLEELLSGTPADVFASVWLTWRKTNLFHIHYTELLRLAALYKYGGVYLDTDIIVLKPLDLSHNIMGEESLENNKQRLNGAVMVFNKSSPFLLECLTEFTETYDDRLLDYNGAELVTRVASGIAEDGKNKTLHIEDLHIEPSRTFFPLSRKNITRYFTAPTDEQEKLDDNALLSQILNQSTTVHFWNQETHRLVPESGSIVERIINLHCIRCHEYL